MVITVHDLQYSEKVPKMSLKVENLLKKATTFEKLSLFGDRKAFLTAIAQDPGETVSAYHAVNTAVKGLSAAIQNFITESAEVQENLPGRMKGLPSSLSNFAQTVREAAQSGVDANNLQQVLNAARNLAWVRNLGNMGDVAKNAWFQNVLPAASAVSDAAVKVPVSEALPAEHDQAVELAPAQNSPASVKPTNKLSINPADLKKVQDFVNKQMLSQFPPVMVDGKWGPETARLVKEWANANNMNGLPLQTILDAALAGASGYNYKSGPELDQARKTQ